MIHSLPKKHSSLKNLLNLFFITTVLSIVSLLPIFKSFGRLNIGHDTLIPLIPEFSFKMAHEWIDTANGVYMSNNIYAWILPFYILSKLGLGTYEASFVYQFLIYFLSGLGIYKIYNLFNPGNRLFALIPAIFIILSPHYLDHQIYYQGTIGIVWVAYFTFKFIKNKKFFPLDVIFLSLSLGTITDLPNPKYHFLIFILMLSAIIIAIGLKLLSFKDILINKINFLLLFLSSLYLSLPYIYYGYDFLKDSGVKIFVKQGYKETGVALDYGYALIGKMIRLFHSPNLNPEAGKIIESPFFVLAYYAIPIIVLGVFPFILRSLNKYLKKIYIVFYFLTLLFLFLSKSSNPPFGFVYDYLLTNYKAFAFMRTTAGIIIFVALFYALIYGRVFQFIAEKKDFKKQYKLFSLLFLLIILFITSYPFWSGHYYLNRSTVNPYVNRSEYGMKIPEEYFQSASFLKKIKLDSKIDVYPHAINYQNNNWGYFGFLIYPWLIDKPMVAFNKITIEGRAKSNTNALYIYHDKTLEQNYGIDNFWHIPEKLVFASEKIDIYRKPYFEFLPHFYTAKSIFYSPSMTDKLLKRVFLNRQALFDDKKSFSLSQRFLSLFDQVPFIEYKKINPAKYRVMIHGASKPFLLSFTENYHPKWKIYLKARNKFENKETLIGFVNNYYKLFSNNENDQADGEEVKQFIKNGWISTLGSLKVRKNDYFTFNDGKRIFDYTEDYKIDFISKNFKETIQNNNLENSTIYETMLLPSLNEPHFRINGYANAWILDPSRICKTKENFLACFQNGDGLYDFELIVEFFPQKVANVSYTISAATFFILAFFSFIKFSSSLCQRIVLSKPSLKE